MKRQKRNILGHKPIITRKSLPLGSSSPSVDAKKLLRFYGLSAWGQRVLGHPIAQEGSTEQELGIVMPTHLIIVLNEIVFKSAIIEYRPSQGTLASLLLSI